METQQAVQFGQTDAMKRIEEARRHGPRPLRGGERQFTRDAPAKAPHSAEAVQPMPVIRVIIATPFDTRTSRVRSMQRSTAPLTTTAQP